MTPPIARHHTQVLVVGGGAAGVAAAMAASDNGADVVLIERGTALGGELIGGLPYLGTHNAAGEPIVGGPFSELISKCDELDGHVGTAFDGRLMYGTLADPEVMKLAVVDALAERRIRTILGTTVDDVIVEDGRVVGVLAPTKHGRTLHTADLVIDASGDGDVVHRAGGAVWIGDGKGTMQPVSLVFRMSHIDFDPLLAFIRDNPDEFTLAESPAITKSAAECAMDIYRSGIPFAMLQGEREGSRLSTAIASGSMYQTTGIWMWPTSMQRREMGFNTTRVSGVDGTDQIAMADALAQLTLQVQQAMAFLRAEIPGFSGAHLSGVAPKVGIRETRRIQGDVVLGREDVLRGIKRPDGVAKGGHHVDIHGEGTYQKRIPVDAGMSYDIPYGALIPERLTNVIVAGRCVSSDREANGSARVIGTCMAMGQAAGTAAAIVANRGLADVRDCDVAELRTVLTEQGGIVDGTK